MTAPLSLQGCAFGRLTVLSPAGSKSGRRMWTCRCNCGTEFDVRGTALTTGRTSSCGCGRVSAMAAVGAKNATHGLSSTPEYRSWARMIHRCYEPTDIKFDLYGGRGIRVCDRWRSSFEAFFEDMGRKPLGRPTIDRISPDGHYEPGNCRWASYQEQNLNRRPFVGATK